MKFKKLLLICSCLYAISVMPDSVFANTNLIINGNALELEVSPTVIDGRTLIPIQGIEKIDSQISFEYDQNKITITKDDTNIKLTIDNNIALINNIEVELDTMPKIINDTYFIPLRFVAETFNCNIGWNNKTNTAIITSKFNIAEGEFLLDENLIDLKNNMLFFD